MRFFEKSHKLDHVCYDVRGPVVEEANRMMAHNIDILKLNIGNPAPFGFQAPEEIIMDMQSSLRNAEGYSDSKGIFSARKAIMQYCQLKGIPNVGMDDIYIGNGVSEMITMTMQGLLDDGDEILIPAPDYPLWTAAANLAGGHPVHYICDEKADWMPDLDDIESKITQAQSMGCGDSSGESEIDEYFEKAGRFIIEKDKASIGMLQRLLKIGFNRAARIMDQLADAGVVGPEEGTKPRKILMSMEEFEDYIDNYV